MLLRIISFLVILLSLTVQSVPAADNAPVPPAGLSVEEALRLGEAMYMKGMLPSGKPMEATVQGDLKVSSASSAMVTCSNCHMRSGLGSYEGLVLTPPTNGAILYAPLLYARDLPGIVGVGEMVFEFPRPPYTDESLAMALRYGADPTGRPLLETMPHYILDDREMAIMIFYLKNLSSKYSPGVTANDVRFATIVTEGVSLRDRNAMLDPMKAFLVDVWNASVVGLRQWRPERTHRTLSLDVWELKGSPDTWYGQLEALYRRQPVFALVGGLSSGSWGPIHEFCEKNRIPCILPLTDLPVVSGDEFYTLYFSKGYYQEGETAAKFLERVLALPAKKQVVQVYREDERSGALAKGFADTWKRTGSAAIKTRVLAAGETTGKEFWKGLASTYKDASLVLWLGPADLAGIEELAAAKETPSSVFVSSTMLAGAFSSIPDSVRDFTYITYPNRLPGEEAYAASLTEAAMKYKKIPLTNMDVSSKVFFLTRMVSTVLLNLREDYYRDYFLDLFDVQGEQTTMSVAYPRVSFGPGQRYASKGCYVVTLTKGPQPKIVSQTEWVIY
jgi:substrate-binding family protein